MLLRSRIVWLTATNFVYSMPIYAQHFASRRLRGAGAAPALGFVSSCDSSDRHPSESEIHPEESHMTLLVRPIPPVGMRDILLQSRLHYPEFACGLFHLNPYIAHFHPSQESGDEVR